jgi:hypothetical protein
MSGFCEHCDSWHGHPPAVTEQLMRRIDALGDECCKGRLAEYSVVYMAEDKSVLPPVKIKTCCSQSANAQAFFPLWQTAQESNRSKTICSCVVRQEQVIEKGLP